MFITPKKTEKILLVSVKQY